MLETILSGLRVIDLTQNVAGPFCTEILGDFGAEVIKVERPGRGDDTRSWLPPAIGGQSSTFLALNRNKKSVCLDIATPEGQDAIRRLAESADILVHSMRPGSAEAKGLGYDDLKPVNPKLIYCAISAFGEVGPLRSLPGYDPLMQAFSGIMSVTGNEGDAPVRVSVSLIDMGTGLWAALGILAGVIERLKHGQGVCVRASLLETGLSWMTVLAAGYMATGKLPKKLGSGMSMASPYELFRSADGYVFIGAGNDGLFAKVCEALDLTEMTADPRFATNSARVQNREAVHETLEARTATVPSKELVEKLRAAGAPCSEMNDVSQILSHEQTEALGMVAPMPVPDAPQHRVLELPLTLNGKRSAAKEPPPALGAHDEEILGGLDRNG